MLAQVKSAHGRIAAVRAALQSPSPEELGRCISLLGEAIACLQAREPDRDWQRAELSHELGALRFGLGACPRNAVRVRM